MAVVALNDAGGRHLFFQRSVLANLQYWQTWLADKLNDTAALDRERNGIVRALTYALELDDAWDMAFELIDKLAPYMERRGYWDSWGWVLEQGLRIAQRGDNTPQLATLHQLLGRLRLRQSRSQEGVAHYRRAIRFSRQIGDLFNEGRACTNLGYDYVEQGNWYRAEVLCCHALNIFKKIGNDHGCAHSENHLGLLYTRQGRWETARSHLENACNIWRFSGDAHGLMRGFINLSHLYLEMKCPNKAISWAYQALDQAKLTGDESEVGSIYVNIGEVYRLNNEFAKAMTFTRQAEVIHERFSNLIGLAVVRENLGQIYLAQGNWYEAHKHLENSLIAWRSLESQNDELRVRVLLVECELIKGNQQRAIQHLVEAEQLSEKIKHNSISDQLEQKIIKYRRNLIRSAD